MLIKVIIFFTPCSYPADLDLSNLFVAAVLPRGHIDFEDGLNKVFCLSQLENFEGKISLGP